MEDLLTEGSRLNDRDVIFIHSQLKGIQQSLKNRYDDLMSLEKELKDREEVLNQQVEVIETIATLLDQRQEKVEERERELNELEKKVRGSVGRSELSKENKRLRANFDTLRETHSFTKSQLKEVSSKNDSLVNQISSLHARLSCLKATNESLKRAQPKTVTEVRKDCKPNEQLKTKSVNCSSSSIKTSSANDELLLLVMHWVTKAQLYINRHLSPNDDLVTSTSSISLKTIPLLVGVDLLTISNQSYKLILLEFIHMSVTMLDHEQRSIVATSLRRLGENCLESALMDAIESVNINMLCSLIVLQLIHNQIDKVSKVFELLETSLRNDAKVQEIFHMYQGLPCILRLLSVEKWSVIHSKCISILLSLTSEPVFIDKLTSCVSTLIFHLKQSTIDDETLEKLSVVLQKLSKHKIFHSSFHSSNGVHIIQETIMNGNIRSDFVKLNLKSVLINIKT